MTDADKQRLAELARAYLDGLDRYRKAWWSVGGADGLAENKALVGVVNQAIDAAIDAETSLAEAMRKAELRYLSIDGMIIHRDADDDIMARDEEGDDQKTLLGGFAFLSLD